MSKLKILVVEDEVIIADNICDTLESLGYEPMEPAINYSQALERIEESAPDIAILDIELSGNKSGIDLARTIKTNYNFPFIFLTSNADSGTISEAKKVNPPAYLVKPFTRDELFSAIEIALFNFSEKEGNLTGRDLVIQDSIFLKKKDVFTKIHFDSILFIRSAHVYAEIVLKNEKVHVVRVSLNDLLSKLSSKFIRIHRGYIVNTQYLDEISTNSVRLCSECLPVGKKFKENLLSKINLI